MTPSPAQLATAKAQLEQLGFKDPTKAQIEGLAATNARTENELAEAKLAMEAAQAGQGGDSAMAKVLERLTAVHEKQAEAQESKERNEGKTLPPSTPKNDGGRIQPRASSSGGRGGRRRGASYSEEGGSYGRGRGGYRSGGNRYQPYAQQSFRDDSLRCYGCSRRGHRADRCTQENCKVGPGVLTVNSVAYCLHHANGTCRYQGGRCRCAKHDLATWLQLLGKETALDHPLLHHRLSPPPSTLDINIASDASEFGIGVVVGQEQQFWELHPKWRERASNIHLPESFAVELALSLLLDVNPPRDVLIQCLCDNETVVKAWEARRSSSPALNHSLQ
ncbi:hypothetical protein JCM1840_002147 [Sporobolomyces johnsonii]